MNMMCKGRFDLSKLSNELRLDPSQNQTSLYVGGNTIIDRVPSVKWYHRHPDLLL